MGCEVKKGAACILILLSLCVAGGGAAWPQTTTPTVNDILARYVTALGGRAAISRLTTRVSKGTLEVVGVEEKGTAESYAKAPNKYLSVITIPGYGEIRRVFDGLDGWLVTPDGGATAMMGQDLSSTRRASEFYQPIELAKLYPKLSLKGKEDVDGKPAYIVVGDPDDGTIRRMYFDVASGLLVRNDEEVDSPQGRDTAVSFIGDYRDVEGTKQAFTFRQVHGKVTLIVRLTEIHVNVPVDDSKFAKPSVQ